MSIQQRLQPIEKFPINKRYELYINPRTGNVEMLPDEPLRGLVRVMGNIPPTIAMAALREEGATAHFCPRGAVGDQQCMESPGFINPTIGTEQARGPMTKTRTVSEIQSGTPSMEGPYPRQHDETKAMTPKTTEQGADGALQKVKKTNKPKKKESKKMGEKKKEVIAEVMIAGRLQQGGPGPVGAPEGERQ